MGRRVAECGGAALIVDYGEEQGEVVENGVEEQVEGDEEKNGSSGRRIERDTLRAFRHHKQVHPLVSANHNGDSLLSLKSRIYLEPLTLLPTLTFRILGHR